MKKTTLGINYTFKSTTHFARLKNSVVKPLKAVVISRIGWGIGRKHLVLCTEQCSEQHEKGLALWDKTSLQEHYMKMKKTTLGHQSYPKSIALSSRLKNSVVKPLKAVVISLKHEGVYAHPIRVLPYFRANSFSVRTMAQGYKIMRV